MEKLSTRAGYGKALVELAEKYNYYVLDADLAEATKTIDLTKKYPEQVRYIPVQDSLELYDIDTKEDLEKLFLRQNNV